VPDIEQRDLVTQQQRGADLRGVTVGGSWMVGLDENGANLARLRLPVQLEVKHART